MRQAQKRAREAAWQAAMDTSIRTGEDIDTPEVVAHKAQKRAEQRARQAEQQQAAAAGESDRRDKYHANSGS